MVVESVLFPQIECWGSPISWYDADSFGALMDGLHR
jgi:hypothetical protein